MVLTSSIASCRFSPNPSPVVDEASWSDVEFMKSKMMDSPVAAYALAKTQQEIEATRLCKGEDVRVDVVIFYLCFGLLSMLQKNKTT